MYRNHQNELVYSPSDLIRFMESPFASWMQRLHLERPDRAQPDEQSEELKLIAQTGIAHEADYLATLKQQGRDVCEVPQDREQAADATRRAIAEGPDIVYQGYLVLPPFAGYTDFLVRVEGVNSLYEVWDAKLARKTKPYYLIQLCCYAEMLEQVQGTRSEYVRVILGTTEIKRYRTDDFFHYYVHLKRAFLTQMETFDVDGEPPAPDPRADHGLWQSHADDWLVKRDNLVQVAGISVSQIRKLNEAGIQTLTDLSATREQRVPKLGDNVFRRLVAQASMQIKTRQIEEQAPDGQSVAPAFCIMEPDEVNPRSGLAILPPPSAGDVFFDIEGFPLKEKGLEYLLGAVTVENGEASFHDWWAHNATEERGSFQQFIDWVYRRWQDDPSMHIYHYAPYEVTAMRRLMGLYGTREDEVDALLRNSVFVDLYQIVRQGLVLGTTSYSLKSVERLYMEKRESDVTTAAASMVSYAWWIESGQPPDWQKSPILKGIRDYNEEDCVSTWKLAEWLWNRQREYGIKYFSKADDEARNHDKKEVDEPAVNERVLRRRELGTKLLEAIPHDSEQRAHDADHWRIQKMLAYLLEFHRREEKPIWWAMFDRHSKTEEELIDDLDCLGGLWRTDDEPETIARSLGFWYAFGRDQETKLIAGKIAIFSHDLDTKVIISQFDPKGRVQLKLSRAALAKLPDGEMPSRLSLIPDEFVSHEQIENAVLRLVEAWDDGGEMPAAFRRFLLREPPQVAGHSDSAPLLTAGEDTVAGCVRIARNMSGSTLCIQGPPGAGKTYTASHMIVQLLRLGKNVGVTSNSHQAILNLMKTCHETLGGQLDAIKVGGDATDPVFEQCPGIRRVAGGQAAVDAYRGGLIGGTAWLFSHPGMQGRVDYLFVDEAGQVSVANLGGMCQATDNIVLVGDQMQLGQPIQGIHPGDSGQSLLEYLLQDNAVVPEHLGVFLDRTWRLHPKICSFISGGVYEGHLHANPSTENRVVRRPDRSDGSLLPEAGMVFAPVRHHGNTQSSEEEVERIIQITNGLLGREYTDCDGRVVGLIVIEDIVFVAPYNMQVRCLREALPDGARVGSVDKFQGQEAPVVIVSMCSSAGDFGSRGIGFVLNKNRLNVAVSRAQSLAIIVGDPEIAHTPVGTVENMRRVNLFCRIMEEAKDGLIKDDKEPH